MTGKQLKISILQWAIQGKLVPQDPSDEPASVLLERIRTEKVRLVKEGKIKKDKNESIIYRGEDNSHYEKIGSQVRCIDDEIPFELPNGWEWCRLGSCINLMSGRDMEPHQYNSNKRGIPYMTGASNFINGELIVNRWTESPITIAPLGSLLITCKGTIGELAFNRIGDIHIARQIMAILGEEKLLSYIRLFLEFKVNELESQANSMIPGISRDVLLSILFPMPPREEQKRIASRFESLSPLIEQYSHLQGNLSILEDNICSDLKKSVLQYAIEGKLVSQDPADEPAIDLLERIKAEKERLFKEKKIKRDKTESVIFRGDDNKYYEQVGKEVVDITEEIPFDIPTSWEWTRLETLVSMSIGKTPSRSQSEFWDNGNIPWVSISDMRDYGRISCTKEYVSENAKAIMGQQSPIGTLIMSFKLTVGRTSILDIPAYHNEAIVTIKPICDAALNIRNYLFLTLPLLSQSGDSKDAIKGKTLNSKSLNNLLVPLPPYKTIVRIILKVQQLFEHLDSPVNLN